MSRKKKVDWVYCPKCGEVSDASLLYCTHCKESLRGANELDPDEAKIKKRRERSIKRDTRRRAIKAKKKALFEKVPVLEPLYYMAWIGFVIGMLAILVQIFKASELAGFIVITIAFICFYLWYAPIIIDNTDFFDYYIDQLPLVARARERKVVYDFMWGLVIGGFIIVLCLLGLVGSLIMDIIG